MNTHVNRFMFYIDETGIVEGGSCVKNVALTKSKTERLLTDMGCRAEGVMADDE